MEEVLATVLGGVAGLLTMALMFWIATKPRRTIYRDKYEPTWRWEETKTKHAPDDRLGEGLKNRDG